MLTTEEPITSLIPKIASNEANPLNDESIVSSKEDFANESKGYLRTGRFHNILFNHHITAVASTFLVVTSTTFTKTYIPSSGLNPVTLNCLPPGYGFCA